jgi:glucuronosyltransferase
MMEEDNSKALATPGLQQLLATGNVDVVCAVTFGNDAGYYLADRLNASLVLIHTGVISLPWLSWAVGDPYNPAINPMPLTGYSQTMTFAQRLVNTLASGLFVAFNEFYLRPLQHGVLKKAFPEERDIPSIGALMQRVALVITHGSPFLGDGRKPSMPQVVQAGLMNCRPTDPLPDKLAHFLETAQHGVIFVSFGSLINPSAMPEAKRLAMMAVFSKLKQRVIWKWDAAMPDAPANVLVSSWLPQPALLAHPNLKLFITHAGAGSLQETICYTTPIIAIPINSDQFVNANEAVLQGLGLKLDWHSLTEESLGAAVEEVVGGPGYQAAVERLQRRVLDRPQHPLDHAVWWLEYLLRHPGNPGMASPGHALHWAQHLLLDVAVVLLATGLLAGWILYRAIACCCRRGRKVKRE